MYKVLAFDLDGTLVDTKPYHFKALNDALLEIGAEYLISNEEHVLIYDGLPTMVKLEKLHTNKGLPKQYFDQVWKRKQEITVELLKTIPFNPKLVEMLRKLRSDGYRIAVCSNSIRPTIDFALKGMGIYHLVDKIVSTDDNVAVKPNAGMYLATMVHFKINPQEMVIFEDSPHGLMAATLSGAKVYNVKNPESLNYEDVTEFLKPQSLMQTKYENHNLNVLIPCAGRGSRFEKEGYNLPKFLIDVGNQTMIGAVVDSLNTKANYIYIVQKEHYEKYQLKYLLELITPGCKIVQIDGITDGAACTVLAAKDLINNDNPLVIANSDQIMDNFDMGKWLYSMFNKNADGSILTFPNQHIKWSYVKYLLDNVLEVAEKRVVSDKASVGLYAWNKGKEAVQSIESMIGKNIRTNNEFYLAPSYNELIEQGKSIKYFDIENFFPVGTPEDLRAYQKR